MTLNLAICGHHSHGKSTLAGRLVVELHPDFSEDDLERRFARALAAQDKKSPRNLEQFKSHLNPLSYFFLRHRNETYERGSLNEPDAPHQSEFPVRARVLPNLTLVDNPGGKFVDNLIYGFFLADAAVLVVEGKQKDADGEPGLVVGTQTQLRALVSLGVPIVAIYVSKLDAGARSELAVPEEAEHRFDVIRGLLREVLAEIQVEHEVTHSGHATGLADVPIIPISALTGAGFAAGTLPWYAGPDALAPIVGFAERTPDRAETDLPTRFVTQGPRELYGVPGQPPVISGVLETGKITVGDELVLEPASSLAGDDVTVMVKSIQAAKTITEEQGEPLESATSRGTYSLVVTGHRLRALRQDHLRKGGVLARVGEQRPQVARVIEADLVFFEPADVYGGKEYEFEFRGRPRTGRILELLRHQVVGLDEHDPTKARHGTRTGEMVRARVRFYRDTAPMCLESEPRFGRLTRFLLRDERKRIVGCGRCREVTETARSNVVG